MLNTIKHITDDNLFFQEGALWLKMWFSCFPILPGSAEMQVTWGGIVRRILIAYFISNISDKKY